jgi:chromosome segregation ATPase
LRAFAIIAICVAFLFGLACSDADEHRNGDDTASERDEFVQDAENRIADLRAELENIRDDLASGDAGQEVKEQADNLEDRLHDAEAELDDLRAAHDDEWEDLKAGFNDAIGEADALIDDIAEELGLN